MDIEILLALQQFRNGAGAFLADFLSKMTFLGEVNSALLIMAVTYWCISKKIGSYLFWGWSGNRFVNGFLKVTACVYRPWIRDPRVVPYGDSMTTATGYSFPSGHTTNAASVFGGIAVRKDMQKLLRIILGVLVVLVAFSRNYLGVHTPQDVLVGALTGLLVMWLTVRLMNWIEAHPQKDWMVLCAGIGIAVAIALYAGLKSYPADYSAEGVLLVDGAKMANDTFKGAGWGIAFFLGWFLERRFVGFSTDVPAMTKILRFVVGVFAYYVVSLIFAPLLKGWIPGPAGTLVSCFIQMFYISFLFPWCMKYVDRCVK